MCRGGFLFKLSLVLFVSFMCLGAVDMPLSFVTGGVTTLVHIVLTHSSSVLASDCMTSSLGQQEGTHRMAGTSYFCQVP